MARPVLAIGGLALIGIGVVMAFGAFSETKVERPNEFTEQIRSVRVDNNDSSVSIRAADVTTTTVHQRFSYRWNEPGTSVHVEGDQLVLSGCGWNCDVAYDVVVPRGTTVSGKVDSGDLVLDGVASADVNADSGDVKIRNVAGTVSAKANSGNVELSGIGQDVTARADSGNITGDGLRGKVDAQVSSGSVTLRLDVAQDVVARVDSGNVELTVPQDRYRVEGGTDSGNRDIGITTDSSATKLLRLDTDSGDVTVRAA
ncbi:MAG: hypothetical protein QOI21_3481 [Actinomycetota bacterium]|jgi:hypothetical protein|nr:hypothetical protein [Actinomycetota bacterium]